MGAQYFSLKVTALQTQKTITDVTDFSMEFMQARTYRQIVRQAKQVFPKLLGFQTVSIFFENAGDGDLFTVADDNSKNEQDKAEKNDRPADYVDTSYAKELYFPDDQIVIFPSYMGVSGEVHNNKSLRVEN